LLGGVTQRLDDLWWFYRDLPTLGVNQVLHLGAVAARVVPDVAAAYPRIDGVTTWELVNGGSIGVVMNAAGRDDWQSCDGRFRVFHTDTGARADLFTHYDSHLRSPVNRRARERAMQLTDDDRSEIILVGGHRRVSHAYYHHDRHFVGSVGVFEAKRSSRVPPAPYGGVIVELQLARDGVLQSCALTFRDFSGGLPDV